MFMHYICELPCNLKKKWDGYFLAILEVQFCYFVTKTVGNTDGNEEPMRKWSSYMEIKISRPLLKHKGFGG